MSKIDLRNVNAVTIIYDEYKPALEATIPVIRHMQNLANFGRLTLITALPVPVPLPGVEIIQIWPTDLAGLGHWLSYMIRFLVRHPYMMHFQDDGFILDPRLWRQQFLAYDYIGAPWADGLVGNEGFSIQSQKFLWAKSQFVWDGVDGQDWFYCRTIRDEMQGLGVRFAPTAVASRFSSELCDQDKPTFGYHGRQHCPSKHARGQELITPFR
jgi:hypothetical protein